MGLESWKHAFRVGIAPQLSCKALLALRWGLKTDDPALRQGCTTDPPPLQSVLDWAITGACPIAYAGWHGEGLSTVRAAEEYFSLVCYQADLELGGAGECRWFLNAWDDTPRDVIRPQLLAEVESEIARRLPPYLQPATPSERCPTT